jgi:hypothetical protein
VNVGLGGFGGLIGDKIGAVPKKNLTFSAAAMYIDTVGRYLSDYGHGRDTF